jgi:hypothetical protein
VWLLKGWVAASDLRGELLDGGLLAALAAMRRLQTSVPRTTACSGTSRGRSDVPRVPP